MSNPLKQSLNVMLKRQPFLWAALLAIALVGSPVYGAALLKDFKGAIHSLDEYTGQGKWAIVMIWASDCEACNAEAKEYVKFNAQHKNNDAYILGISTDGHEKKSEALDFIKRHNIDFMNLIDEHDNVAKMYMDLTGAPFVGTPSFLLFSPKGELRAAQLGAVPTHIIESFIEKEAAAGIM